MAVSAPINTLEPPLRGEPFSVEHLWAHATQMAVQHRLADRKSDDRRLIDSFERNSRFIAATYQTITAAVRDGEPIPPAAEWVLDNYHVVEEQVREIREDLPRGFYHELPKLAGGEWAGFPRVYDVAHDLIVHTDSSLDLELIAGFVEAYQRTTPLTSGEIWAVPIMLRLVLVENLRRLCAHILAARAHRRRAERMINAWRLVKSDAGHADAGQPQQGQPLPGQSLPGQSLPGQSDPGELPMTADHPMLVMHLMDCLRASNPEQQGISLAEVAQRLGQPHDTVDDLVRKEQQRLAADQVSIGNLITSMQMLGGLEWKAFFERVSLVEQALREDPMRVYPHLDFASRDMYRHEIEKMAKRSPLDEIQIASHAIGLAVESERRELADARRRHVGFFLIDEGRVELERLIGCVPGFGESLARFVRRQAALLYPGGIAIATAAGGLAAGAVAATWGATPLMSWIVGLLAIVPASELSVAFINLLITNLLRPRGLPKIEFVDRIPPHCHSLIVIPGMLNSEAGIRALLERLEIHYLSNPEPGLQFALLTDYSDAPQEEMPADAALLMQAQAGIRALNARYCGGSEADADDRFHLLHRPRRWNPEENIWMGWERKRGKLEELNELLRGATATSYLESESHRARLSGIKYVITLDADTRLPYGIAKRLIGTIAHPLNRAHVDPALGRVTHGYGILQPRVTVSLASATRSLFARVFANSPGLDPYCLAVSDVYQDLFGEGSYTGKGIYDVDAFRAVVGHAFPENHILSHDLIEGCFARVGLVTDLELFDEYPTRYDADARRRHRWVRGDWQLLPWLMPTIPGESGRRANPLTMLSRWKIFDNLRRSLVAPALVAFFLTAWLWVPAAAGPLTLCALAVLLGPLLAQVLSAAVFWPREVNWLSHLGDLLRDWVRTVVQCGLALAFLPHQAQLMIDAVARTLFRLFVSRRNLLEWETADAAERRLKTGRWSAFREMAWSPVLSVLAACGLAPAARFAAFPVLLAWFAAPALGAWISRATRRTSKPLTIEDRHELRRIARKTWAFFEAFVDADDNWLPPDNVQEYPKEKVAHRISPTNEGLFIISAIAAHEFGFIGLSALVELLERNRGTLEKLERHRGHFYNWYGTQKLEPLPPRYCSTADSGNLAACLIAARQGMLDAGREPLLSQRVTDGVLESVAMVEETLRRFQPRGARFGGAALDALEAVLNDVREAVRSAPADPAAWWRLTEQCQSLSRQLPERFLVFSKATGVRIDELAKKIELLTNHLAGIRQDATTLMPWLRHFADDCLLADHGQTGPAHADHGGGQAWQDLMAELSHAHTPESLATLPERAGPFIGVLLESIPPGSISPSGPSGQREALAALSADIDAGSHQSREITGRILALSEWYPALAMEMDFKLLYSPRRRLFSVGYNLDEQRLDRSHYDLLASESRLASLVAIAKGDVDHRHWFQLGRTLTETAGVKTLLSWGGTMFEYLMPTLLARDFEGSLLDQSCRAAVERQMTYGRQSHVPWGISESAFSTQATNSDYHYQSFGVPGLGLKRGLANDLVISPYSTALALEIDPAAAAANFRHLIAEGADGEWGLYDALDYTPSRVAEGERRNVVFCYMAHHHGMTMAALANCLCNHSMQRRFQGQPLMRATELLLQERIPVAVLEFQPQSDETTSAPHRPENSGPVSRLLSTAATAVPRAHLLSNGQYTVMLTNAGGGYSSCKSNAVTRWRADTTRDDWGQFIYLRNLSTGEVWSAAHQPTRSTADVYEVTYSVDKAEFHRLDGHLETFLEVAVSPENNSEIRQMTIRNHGPRPARVEVTSYAELVLSPAAADAAHPAFSKLFIETEFLADRRALLARRRPRDSSQQPVWSIHVLAVSAGTDESLEFETDRQRFLGRGRTCAAPAALDPGARLSGTTGPVLDPVFSLRYVLDIPSGDAAVLAYVTAFADSREEALLLADQYHDARTVQRTFELAWADSQIELHRLKVTSAGVQLYQRLASAVLFPEFAWRAPSETLKSNTRGQRALWQFGVSGDDPIVLLRVTQPDQRGLVRELLLAHEFWHAHGLKVDLVVLNEHPAGYFDELNDQLRDLVETTVHSPINKPGGVYLLRAAHVSNEDRILLQSVAAVNLHGERGSLMRQIESARERPRPNEPPAFRPSRKAAVLPLKSNAGKPNGDLREPVALQFANKYGGLSPDGLTYSIRLRDRSQTPAPWSNVIANARFGFLVTESGSGFTWAGNSRENKLTSWSNDPVADAPSEAIYIRDEETGAVWSPTPLPIRDDAEYLIEHGQGFSRFVHSTQGIRSELLLSIAPNAPLKFACIKLRNETRQPRVLSATYFAEWVLGVTRDRTQMHVWTSIDEATGALVARNPFHEDVPNQVVFLHMLERPTSVTGDRTEFIGRNGDLSRPAALGRVALSGATGAGIDPCGAVQARLKLAAGEEREVIFLLGQAETAAEMGEILTAHRTPLQVHEAIDETCAFWDQTLGAMQVSTPNRALDALVNRWLVYQTLSCRFWGRSAFFQAGGAYGFRDQLQDIMALVYSQPRLAREHILRAAARQFEPGDVQHWWHPPAGRGVRTRFADDYLWLPLAASHYVATTGDHTVLEQQIAFIQSAPLAPAEEERYEQPETSTVTADLYTHCLRSIEHAFRFGPHGLPLMGCGDWNDGMNKVGVLGQGESVWMAWFLIVVLRRFIPLVEARGDHERVAAYQGRIDSLLQAAEQHAWDGKWYRRAYFDDGNPLGSSANDECRIDSIAQSWSVMAGADSERARLAMQSVEEHLVRTDERLLLLFAPPFDKTPLDPGYIKGYLPGIRENGGQYTHAATWVVQATALQGHGTRAVELFDLINPLLLTSSDDRIDTYQGEPYVVAGDVYGARPHVGRAGWTWYTGSAAWMYRVAVESILGIDIQGDQLRVAPCIPAAWPGFEVAMRRGATKWRIVVNNPHGLERGIASFRFDGEPVPGEKVQLVEDGREHQIDVEIRNACSR